MGEQLAGVAPPRVWVRLAKRETPLGLAGYSEDLELWVTPPEGHRLESALQDLPEELAGGSGDAVRVDQRVTVDEATRGLHLTRRLRVRPARVEPAGYPAFRERIRRILDRLDAGATLE